MSALPSELNESLRSKLNVVDLDFTSVGGGSINKTGKLCADGKDLFLKWNELQAYPKMFEKEFLGLQKLRSANAIDVIEPLFFEEIENIQYLVLTYIKASSKQPDFWRHFGEGLAHLHLTTSTLFGLDHDNYMGALPQKNTYKKTWVEFFIYNRLTPQVTLGISNQLIPPSVANAFETLYGKLEALLPEEPPSLIHGDLWGGNLMTNDKGLPILIDPAICFGSAEADLAMTTLFNGFNPIFLDCYTTVKSLIPGFKSRFELHNLYPLLVHVNLFGQNYLPQVVSILKKYV